MVRRVYVVDRKKLAIVCLVLVLAVAGWLAWQQNGQSGTNQAAFSQRDTAEVTINSITLSPKTVTRDLSYEGIPFPAQQVLNATKFTALVSFQNVSEKDLKDVPVQVVLSVDGKTPVIRSGKIPELAPGATVSVNFSGIPVLGDAKGKNANAGLHQLAAKVLPNPAGGVETASEMSILFFVDSHVK